MSYPSRAEGLGKYDDSRLLLDYMFINKKWTKRSLTCEGYSSLEGVSSDHRVAYAKIRLSLRRYKKQTGKFTRYDGTSLFCTDFEKQVSYSSGDI